MPDNANDQNNNTNNTNITDKGANNNEPNSGNKNSVDDSIKNTGDNITLDYDSVVNFLNTDQKVKRDLFYKFYQSELDSQKHQHLDTWKRNNLEGIVQEKINDYVSKNYPQESESDKRLREIERKFLEKEREAEKERLKNKGMSYANSINLSVGDNMDWLIGNTEEETRSRITWLKDFKESAERDGKNKVIAQNSRVPQSGSDNNGITLDNFKQRYEEGKRKYGINVFAKDTALKTFFDKNADKIKL